MKRATIIFLILCAILTLAACGNNNRTVFTAKVIENSGSLLVEPQKDSDEYKSSDKIVIHANDATIYDIDGKHINLSDITVGQSVKITYNGMIAESYPAQISASKIEIVE